MYYKKLSVTANVFTVTANENKISNLHYFFPINNILIEASEKMGAICRLSLNFPMGGLSLCCCQTLSFKRSLLTLKSSHRTLGCTMDRWAVM